MQLAAWGLSHASAPVAIRERVAFEPSRLPDALTSLTAHPGVREGTIVSTCNRTEIYCALEKGTPEDDLIQWFHHWHDLQQAEIEPCLYRRRGVEVVRHLLRVVSGLDSLVVGEPQISGQVKDAFRVARAQGALGPELGKLFQQAFGVAKAVRSGTAIGASSVSVASTAVVLARQIFGELAPLRAVMLGAGDTAELVAHHLHEAGVGGLTVLNRDGVRASALAARFGGRGGRLSELSDVLPGADIVVTSTASTLPLLGKGAVEHALKRRRHRPMFLVDLAVPRDIEPQIGRLDDVFLYTIDDLGAVAEANHAARREAAGEAERIVDEHVERIEAWRRGLGAVDAIKTYRGRSHELRERALEEARHRLAAGERPERALERLADRLTARLVHDPGVRVRRAAAEGRTGVVSAARELFRLDDRPFERGQGRAPPGRLG